MKESVRGKSEKRVAERMRKAASPKECARGESKSSVTERKQAHLIEAHPSTVGHQDKHGRS
jgi:hypothetical protein